MISMKNFMSTNGTANRMPQEKKICRKHGEYIARQIVPASNGLKPIYTRCMECDSERRAKEQARKVRLQRSEKADKIKKLFGESGTAFDGVTFDQYVCDSDRQREVLRLCQAYARNFDKALHSHTCLLFCGNTGTGKNHLALSIANEIMKKGYTACYIRLLKLISEVRPNYREGKQNYDKIEAFAIPDLLIVDEVGIKANTETEAALMNEVFGVRESHNKPTIFISNLPVRSARPEDTTVEKILGARIMDRMKKGDGRELIFNWPSYRSNIGNNGVFN